MPDTSANPQTATAPAANTGHNTTGGSAPTTAPSPTAPPEPEASTRSQSPFNRAQLEEMSKCERLFNLALTDPFKAVLVRREIPDKKITGLVDKIIKARNQAATAGEAANSAASVSFTEAEAELELLTDIRTVQAAAKQKYARSQPEVLNDYLVGTEVNESRAMLEQSSQSLLNKLDSERPPGVDTEFIERMENHRAAYVGANVTQGTQGLGSRREHEKRDQFIEEIKDARVEIQYAIDAEYPPTKAENAAVRKLFDLPANRPFNAIRRKSP